MKKTEWKKNLFENQDFEDNYTDKSFLKDLRKNQNLKDINIFTAIKEVTKVSQEISTVVLFLVVFSYLYENSVMPQKLLFNSFALTGSGYIIYIGMNIQNLHNFVEDIKTSIVVLLFGYLFSPMLHTLTDSISTDTIFSTTFISLFFHILLHDYGLAGFLVSKTISLNCSIFASICLASRLSTSLHAFVLLVISVQFFVLKPLLFEKIWHPLMIFPITIITLFYLFLQFSKLIVIIYVLTLIFINIVCPLIFKKLHHYKSTLSGPWDETVIGN
jgi:phosphatidylinositol N-acetylglucosaminyltransferase subunit C